MANIPDHGQLHLRSRSAAPAARTCREVMANLWEYLDGELPGAMTASIHAHVAACRRCRAQRDARAALTSAVAWAARSDLAPDTLRARVRAMLRDRELRS